MRIVHQITAILGLGLLLTSCSSSYSTYVYDDLYYSPNNDPIKEVQKNPREDFNKTNDITYQNNGENRYSEDNQAEDYPRGIYRNRYTEAESIENSQPAEGSVNQENHDDQYYDEGYASSLQQMNSPVRTFNTYDPYQRDRILYTQDPFFTAPTVYGRYQFWDPFVPSTGLSVGWNSFNGWNVGVYSGFGFGYGGFGYGGFNCAPLNPFYGYYDPFFDPFWGTPWRYGYGNLYSPYNRFGWGFNNGYNQGYRDGFYNGINYGNYNVYSGTDGARRANGRRQTSIQRGSRGSGVPTTNNDRTTRRPNSTVSGSPRKGSATTRPSTTTTRPRSQETPAQTETRPRTNTPRQSAPTKYSTPKRPATYSRPSNESRPSNGNRPSYNSTERNSNQNNAKPRQETRPSSTPSQRNTRPTYSRPQRQNNSYNRPSTQPRPQQTTPRTSPQRNSTPTYNRSKPSYNNNRSTPSYSAPRRSTPSRSSGGSSSGGSRSRRR